MIGTIYLVYELLAFFYDNAVRALKQIYSGVCADMTLPGTSQVPARYTCY